MASSNKTILSVRRSLWLCLVLTLASSGCSDDWLYFDIGLGSDSGSDSGTDGETDDETETGTGNGVHLLNERGRGHQPATDRDHEAHGNGLDAQRSRQNDGIGPVESDGDQQRVHGATLRSLAEAHERLEVGPAVDVASSLCRLQGSPS